MNMIDRLAALPALAGVPREQLQWLLDHGAVRRGNDGEVYRVVDDDEMIGLFLLIEGRFSVRVHQGGVEREVREILPGNVTGSLPYSRMKNPRGYLVADGPVEFVVLPLGDIPEMTRQCYELTELCVHEMLERVRAFKSDDKHQEKLAAREERLVAWLDEHGVDAELTYPLAEHGFTLADLDAAAAALDAGTLAAALRYAAADCEVRGLLAARGRSSKRWGSSSGRAISSSSWWTSSWGAASRRSGQERGPTGNITVRSWLAPPSPNGPSGSRRGWGRSIPQIIRRRMKRTGTGDPGAQTSGFLGILVAAITAFAAAPASADTGGYAYLQGNLPMLFLALAMVYPVSSFGEEVIYRGFLMTRLAEMGSGTKAAWGMAHFAWAAIGIVQTTFMGAAFAASYLWVKRNLWVLILAHAYMDTLLLVQVYLTPSASAG